MIHGILGLSRTDRWKQAVSLLRLSEVAARQVNRPPKGYQISPELRGIPYLKPFKAILPPPIIIRGGSGDASPVSKRGQVAECADLRDQDRKPTG